jgi:hypothetical protein
MISNPSCSGGADNESSVTGRTTANGQAAVGQFIQASAGPGGEPISDVPATSDKNGNFKVTLICGGKACNGVVDNERRQLSPFVRFSFSGGCRHGVVNFQKR